MTWLGQKQEPEAPRSATPVTPVAPQVAAAPAMPMPTERHPIAQSAVASIGKSLHVKGELSGNEDLAIEGKVEGKITLNGCNVTVGQTGRVSAEIQAKTVIVSGLVHGNISAAEMVEVTATGTMLGDIRSPRVKLVDGAKFKGSIDMESRAATTSQASASASSSNSARREDAPAMAASSKSSARQEESPAMAAAGKS
jgi:cytoskeletal protein CcmA (bactofilin family)